jgi:small redox-active disulfide protein 2
LYDDTEQAAEELGLEFEMHKITDIRAISGFGVMTTPALVIDGEVKCVGKVPSREELKALIRGE